MKLIEVNDFEREIIQNKELIILEEIDRVCRINGIKYMIAYGTLIGAIRHGGFIPWDDDIDICMMREDYDRFREACKKDLDSKFFYQSNSSDPEYFYLFDKIRLNNTIFRESYISSYNINHGIYVDIFPIDYVPDNIILRQIQYVEYQICRAALHAKYMLLSARKGKKKIAFAILRFMFILFPKQFLYNRAVKIAQRYNTKKGRKVTSFVSRYRKKDVMNVEMYSELEMFNYAGVSTWIPKGYDEYLTSLYGDYMQLPPIEKRNTVHDLTELKL